MKKLFNNSYFIYEKEDSKTLIKKLIKNKNNINFYLIIIVFNNKKLCLMKMIF